MVRKVFEKAGLIGGLHPLAGEPAAVEVSKARTAPGTMLGFLSAQSAAIQESDALRDRLRAAEETSPLQRLDPACVSNSKWANRHEASFKTQEFEALKSEIRSAGGNVQPIKVRPVSPLNGSTGPQRYELVYGHRRHRACQELGLSVLAVIEEVPDLALFEQMERENRGRKNLSAWEQGNMYRKALDDGLYPSLRRLAEALSIDVSLVSKSLTLARLPDQLISAFESPLDIQYRWAGPLAEAVQKDPERTLARANSIISSPAPKPKPTEIFRMLTSLGDGAAVSASEFLVIKVAGKKAAMLQVDREGRVVLEFEAGVLPEGKRKALVKAIENFLKE